MIRTVFQFSVLVVAVLIVDTSLAMAQNQSHLNPVESHNSLPFELDDFNTVRNPDRFSWWEAAAIFGRAAFGAQPYNGLVPLYAYSIANLKCNPQQDDWTVPTALAGAVIDVTTDNQKLFHSLTSYCTWQRLTAFEKWLNRPENSYSDGSVTETKGEVTYITPVESDGYTFNSSLLLHDLEIALSSTHSPPKPEDDPISWISLRNEIVNYLQERNIPIQSNAGSQWEYHAIQVSKLGDTPVQSDVSKKLAILLNNFAESEAYQVLGQDHSRGDFIAQIIAHEAGYVETDRHYFLTNSPLEDGDVTLRAGLWASCRSDGIKSNSLCEKWLTH